MIEYIRTASPPLWFYVKQTQSEGSVYIIPSVNIDFNESYEALQTVFEDVENPVLKV